VVVTVLNWKVVLTGWVRTN